MTKALGMTVYFSTEDTGALATFTAVCATSVDGGGAEASAETLEACLDDTVIYEFPADPKYAQQTIEYKKIETPDNDDISADMEEACLNTTLCSYALKIPLATPVWAYRTAYIISHTDMTKERNQDMKCSIVFAPQSAWEYSLTAPTTA